MADPVAACPHLIIKNTFVHCKLPGGEAEACRSLSCPPRERPTSPRAPAVVYSPAPLARRGEAQRSFRDAVAAIAKRPSDAATPSAPAAGRQSRAVVAPAGLAAAVGAKGSPASASGTSPKAAGTSSSSSPKSGAAKLDRQNAIAVVARGPPPYAPPVAKSAHLAADKRTASGPPGGGEVAGAAAAGSPPVSHRSAKEGAGAAKLFNGAVSKLEDNAADVQSKSAAMLKDAVEVKSASAAMPKDGAELKSTSVAMPKDGADVQSTSAALPKHGAEVKSTSAAMPKVGEEASPEEDGDWAVVEVKRKKRPQLNNGFEEETSAPSQERMPARQVPSTRSLFAAAVAAMPSQRLVHHHLEVGIEEDAEFHVVKRLLGKGGANMDRIRGECEGTKVELRGDGAKALGRSSGPLVLHIKGTDASQCAKALARATELVTEIRQEHETFMATGTKQSSSAKVELPCDYQEESTSADDSMHALNDVTDSEAGSLDHAPVALPSKTAAKQKNSTAGTPQLAGTEGRSGSSMGALVHHEVPVCITHCSQFPTVRKVIGPGGENMKNISTACPGTKVELRGSGTNPWNGGESGPLVLHIRGYDSVQCAAALKLANELIDGVRKEHQLFLDSRASR